MYTICLEFGKNELFPGLYTYVRRSNDPASGQATRPTILKRSIGEIFSKKAVLCKKGVSPKNPF